MEDPIDAARSAVPRARAVAGLFAAVLVPLFGFGLLAEEVIEQERFGFDLPVLLFLHAHASPVFDAIMVAATHAGSALALVPLNLAVIVWLRQRREYARMRFWACAVVGAALLNMFAKLSFARARPALWLSLLPETTYSFPSGHAMASMAAAAAAVWLLWPSRWRISALALGVCFVGLVGLSRIYLGVHYPSDVLAGWLASFAWVSGLALLWKVHDRPVNSA